MVYIEAVHMSGGTGHQHISHVRWRNPSTGESQSCTREVMIDWIQNKNGVAKVTDGRSTVQVMVVHSYPPYLRTHRDGTPTDNLLYLPKY